MMKEYHIKAGCCYKNSFIEGLFANLYADLGCKMDRSFYPRIDEDSINEMLANNEIFLSMIHENGMSEEDLEYDSPMSIYEKITGDDIERDYFVDEFRNFDSIEAYFEDVRQSLQNEAKEIKEILDSLNERGDIQKLNLENENELYIEGSFEVDENKANLVKADLINIQRKYESILPKRVYYSFESHGIEFFKVHLAFFELDISIVENRNKD